MCFNHIMEFFNQEVKISSFREEFISRTYLSWLNNQEHMKYSAQNSGLHSQASSVAYLESFDNRNNSFLAISVKDTLVGTATMYLNSSYGTASIGILIGPEFAGRGYGKMAWELLTGEIALEYDVRKVSAGTADGNIPMLRLMESSGMQFEARLVSECIVDSLPTDILIYSKFLTKAN